MQIELRSRPVTNGNFRGLSIIASVNDTEQRGIQEQRAIGGSLVGIVCQALCAKYRKNCSGLDGNYPGIVYNTQGQPVDDQIEFTAETYRNFQFDSSVSCNKRSVDVDSPFNR